jgi:hypothetical protein
VAVPRPAWASSCFSTPVAVPAGMAKPTPTLPLLPSPAVAMATLMPITLPDVSTSVPPELPSLMAASVCSRPVSFSDPVSRLRSSADTMPAVTVPVSPSGAPNASTVSPTATPSSVPKVMGVRPVTPTARTRARSWVLSAATTLAGTVRPVDCRTLTVPPESVTWLLVRIRPSDETTTPEPSADSFAPSTRTVTMLGDTRAATAASASPSVTVAAPVVVAAPAGAAAESSMRYRLAMMPSAVPPPATRARTSAPPGTRRGQRRSPPPRRPRTPGGSGGAAEEPARRRRRCTGAGSTDRSWRASLHRLMPPRLPGALSAIGESPVRALYARRASVGAFTRPRPGIPPSVGEPQGAARDRGYGPSWRTAVCAGRGGSAAPTRGKDRP